MNLPWTCCCKLSYVQGEDFENCPVCGATKPETRLTCIPGTYVPQNWINLVLGDLRTDFRNLWICPCKMVNIKPLCFACKKPPTVSRFLMFETKPAMIYLPKDIARFVLQRIDQTNPPFLLTMKYLIHLVTKYVQESGVQYRTLWYWHFRTLPKPLPIERKGFEPINEWVTEATAKPISLPSWVIRQDEKTGPLSWVCDAPTHCPYFMSPWDPFNTQKVCRCFHGTRPSLWVCPQCTTESLSSASCVVCGSSEGNEF